MSTLINVTDTIPARRHIVAQKFLVFTLDREEYGIDFHKVYETRPYEVVTRLVGAPAFIKGVIRLHGVLVPVVDLRIKFQLGRAEYAPATQIVVIKLAGRLLGMVVDSVAGAVTLDVRQIKPAPAIAAGPGSDYRIGLGMLEQRTLIVADAYRLLAGPEITLFDRLAA